MLLSQPIEAAPNLKNGKEIEDNKCYKCHADKSGFGDGSLIYTRKDRRVQNLERLKVMVARCNTELRLDLFPEDEADVTAYLNQQYYKFKP
ncbi:MAG: hypothetical protein EBX45_05385 [Burkholderiaceae bacterium]|nr:hypothetical protein [Burkholderiaceae bacterium]